MKNRLHKKLSAIALSTVAAVLGFSMVLQNGGSAVSASYSSEERTLYRVDQPDENSLSILFNADFSVYKDLKEDDFKKFGVDVGYSFISIVREQLKQSFEKGPSDDFDPTFIGAQPLFERSVGFDFDYLNYVIELVKGNLLDDTYLNTDYIEAFDADDEGVYNKVIAYFLHEWVNAEFALNDENFSKAVILGEGIGYIEPRLQSLVEQAYAVSSEAPRLHDNFLAIAETVTNGVEEDIDLLVQILKLYEIARKHNHLLTLCNYSELTGNQIGLIDSLRHGSEGSKNYKPVFKDIVLNAETSDLYTLFTEVSPSLVVEFLKEINFKASDLKEVFASFTNSEFITLTEAVGIDTIRYLRSNFNNLDPDDLVYDVIDDITVFDVIQCLHTITVDGNVLYEDLSVSENAIKNIIRSLPTMGEIRELADDDMKFTFDIVLGTTFGDIEFDATVGFFGDCSEIRKFAAHLDEFFKFEWVGDELHFNVTAPNDVMRLFDAFFASDVVSEKIKLTIYNLLFSDIGEIIDKLYALTAENIVRGLKGVNYVACLDTLLSAEAINSLANRDLLEQEDIEEAINDFMELVNKANNEKPTFDEIKDYVNKFINKRIEACEKSVDVANIPYVNEAGEYYDKFARILERVCAKNIDYDLLCKFIDPSDTSHTNANFYSRLHYITDHSDIVDFARNILLELASYIPERFRDNSIMDLYNCDGEFVFKRDVAVKVRTDRIADALIGMIPNNKVGAYAREGYDFIADYIPVVFHFDCHVTVPNFYSLTIKDRDGNTLRKIGLPEGADIARFVGIERYGLNYELDHFAVLEGGEYKEIEKMPAADTVVYSLGFNVEISDSDALTYDMHQSNEISLTVTTDAEEPTYTWYYSATATYTDPVKVEGNDGDTLTIDLVKDSGYYCCEVVDKNGITKCTEWRSLNVNRRKIVLTDNPTDLTFDGFAQNPVISSADSEYFDIVGQHDKRNVGTYTSVLRLIDKENTCWAVNGSTDNLDYVWTISILEIEKPTLSNIELVYNGENQSLTFIGTNQEFLTFTNSSATNAGSYKAVVSLTETNNTTWADGSTDDLSFDWTIDQLEVSLPSFDIPEDFTYTGEEHSVAVIGESEYYVVTGETGTDAGEYTVTVSLLDDNYVWADGTSDDIKETWTIAPAEVAIPNVSTDVVFVYDGTEHNLSVAGNDTYYTVSGNGAVEAGEHTLVISLNDPDNYVWEDGSNEDIEIDYEVSKYSVSIPSCANYLTYTGKSQTAPIAESDFYIVEASVGSKAGSYTATVRLIDPDNFMWSDGTTLDLEIEWKINKAKVELGSYHWTNTSFSEDGKTHTIGLSGNFPSTVKVTYSGTTSASKAGEYTAKAVITLTDTANYVFEDGTVTEYETKWTINQPVTPVDPDKPEGPEEPKTPAGLIAGIVVGGVVAVGLIAAAVVLGVKKSKKSE